MEQKTSCEHFKFIKTYDRWKVITRNCMCMKKSIKQLKIKSFVTIIHVNIVEWFCHDTAIQEEDADES